jgi:hypothetical protein
MISTTYPQLAILQVFSIRDIQPKALVFAFTSLHVTLMPVVANHNRGSDFPWRPHLQHYQSTSASDSSQLPRPPAPLSRSIHVVNSPTMAAAIKALNAKIRSNPYSDYFCSTRTLFAPGTGHAAVCARMRGRDGMMCAAQPRDICAQDAPAYLEP